MSDRQSYLELRPSLKGYFWIVGILIALWLGYVWFIDPISQVDNMENRDIGASLRWGISMVLGLTVLAYSGHWWGKALASEEKQLADYRSSVMGKKAEQIAEDARTYSLEIRGSGLAVDDWHQSSIWREIEKKKNNFASIYSQDPNDYDPSLDSREITQSINIRVAFQHSASDSVAYWPIPVFAIAPPKQPEDTGAVGNINSGRNAATLGVTLFLWQGAENTTHAQGMIERLFQFFDANPKVPQALVVSRDGDVTRNGYRVAGTPGLQNVSVIPTVYESMTGLLVTRSDRVDRYIRPFVTNDAEDNQNKNTDLGKLWAFYWDRSRAFDDWYLNTERAKGANPLRAPSTMSSTYWHSQLPDLWRTLSNRGPGEFVPSPWLPARWARHQVAEFDAAPVLGYLHRPIKVSMQDEAGKRLKPALQVKALQTGWLQALDTLPKDQKPARVFYDSTANTASEIALNNALHALNTDGHGIELGNVEEGYDIGRRLGNTGVSSTLVQINLATIASYKDGGVSAVVYSGSDGSVSVQMVRPPNDARKEKNQQNRGSDPFKYGAPGGGS
ncbi:MULTISPECIES: type VI lipase adapter Tla3 domain-containing protein [unclassified Pseudomonas]|uniref:type VI lipase adapter Tla3 domain-containing protein n=2 Tax=unclassified Pseudomonas TaxID=196821 RepID=UPI0030D861C3